MGVNGFLYSQIGYDIKDPMRALVRSFDRNFLSEKAAFKIVDSQTNNFILQGNVKYWGEIWNIHWWEIDFSSINNPGNYKIIVEEESRIVLVSEAFKAGENLLWNETIKTVAIEQLETRAKMARNRHGWKDCGSYWREVNSHATTVIALCELLFYGYEYLGAVDSRRVADQIVQGCDYIAICQDKAKSIGFPEGSIVHEIPSYLHVIPGDVAQSVVAFAKSSRMLADIYPEKSEEYLQRAVKAYEYLLHKAEPIGDVAFSRSNHGAPNDFVVPKEWQTRDLLMMAWGGLELWINGKKQYKEDAKMYVRKVMKRQVPKEKSEDGFYGHFYTFDSCDFTEKANVHHHLGHDTGATFPHYIVPVIEMCGLWHDDPEVPEWRKMIEDFAYGYFLPACSQNPFYLMPEGYFTGEGLLVFCGPWHGINTSIGFAAALAVKLEDFTCNREFRKIAAGNIQWIAGLNAGITRESFKGCVIWNEQIPEGVALPYSQIVGIGNRSVGAWTDIKGTIPNGFDVNPQFQLVVPPTKANDGPWLYTDEDWIPHAAGWITALTYLREKKKYSN